MSTFTRDVRKLSDLEFAMQYESGASTTFSHHQIFGSFFDFSAVGCLQFHGGRSGSWRIYQPSWSFIAQPTTRSWVTFVGGRFVFIMPLPAQTSRCMIESVKKYGETLFNYDLNPLSRRHTPLAQMYLPTSSHYPFLRLASRKGVFLIQTLPGYDDFKMAMMRISPIKHSVPWSSPLQQLGTSSFRQKMLRITTSRPYSVIKSMMTTYFLVLWKISGWRLQRRGMTRRIRW